MYFNFVCMYVFSHHWMLCVHRSRWHQVSRNRSCRWLWASIWVPETKLHPLGLLWLISPGPVPLPSQGFSLGAGSFLLWDPGMGLRPTESSHWLWVTYEKLDTYPKSLWLLSWLFCNVMHPSIVRRSSIEVALLLSSGHRRHLIATLEAIVVSGGQGQESWKSVYPAASPRPSCTQTRQSWSFRCQCGDTGSDSLLEDGDTSLNTQYLLVNVYLTHVFTF